MIEPDGAVVNYSNRGRNLDDLELVLTDSTATAVDIRELATSLTPSLLRQLTPPFRIQSLRVVSDIRIGLGTKTSHITDSDALRRRHRYRIGCWVNILRDRINRDTIFDLDWSV